MNVVKLRIIAFSPPLLYREQVSQHSHRTTSLGREELCLGPAALCPHLCFCYLHTKPFLQGCLLRISHNMHTCGVLLSSFIRRWICHPTCNYLKQGANRQIVTTSICVVFFKIVPLIERTTEAQLGSWVQLLCCLTELRKQAFS